MVVAEVPLTVCPMVSAMDMMETKMLVQLFTLYYRNNMTSFQNLCYSFNGLLQTFSESRRFSRSWKEAMESSTQ